MKIIRYTLLFILLVGFQQLHAQPERKQPAERGQISKEKKAEIESMKIAFLTTKLELTPDEAKKFWPVYNQYSAEKEKMREARRTQRQNSNPDGTTLSDKDYEKIIDGELAMRQQELDLAKKYTAQYKQILPMKKVASLFKAEEEFKKELLDKMREKRQGNGGPKGNR